MEYFSKISGIGGKIKSLPEDFLVEEISEDGTVFEINKQFSRPDQDGNYVHFILQKKNWSTPSALSEISRSLNISQKCFNTAGIKDRVSISTQLTSVSKISKEKLESIRVKDISINGSWYSAKRVSIGGLLGNRFTILVRNFKEGHLGHIVDISAELSNKIPNYFGEQRFGSTRKNTHLVGQLILEGKLEEAIFMFLCNSDGEKSQEAIIARKELHDTKDFRTALKLFPKHLKLERSIISSLAKYPADYLKAFRSLPRNILLLFIHSFQSHLFNILLSDRIAAGEIELEDGEYFCGESFGFPDIEKTEGEGWIVGKLIGYNTNLNQREKDILDKFNISKENFRVSQIPEISSKGTYRTLFAPLRDFSFEGSMFRFSLPSGSYATVAMREFMDNK